MTKAVAIKKKRSWLRWESVRAKKLPWDELWKMESRRIRYMTLGLCMTFCPLQQISVCGKLVRTNCVNCLRQESDARAYVISLLKSLSRWEIHDQMLEALASGIDKELRMRNQRSAGGVNGATFISFVR